MLGLDWRAFSVERSPEFPAPASETLSLSCAFSPSSRLRCVFLQIRQPEQFHIKSGKLQLHRISKKKTSLLFWLALGNVIYVRQKEQ